MIMRLGDQMQNLVTQGKINDLFVSLTVDTGAAASIIRNDLVPKVKVKPLLKSCQLQTATGEFAPVRGTTMINLQIGSRKFKREVIVADITDKFILGLDILLEYKMKVDLQNKVLRFQNEEVPLLTPGKHLHQLEIILKEDEQLPALTERVVMGEIKDDIGGYHTGIIEMDSVAPLKKGLLIAKSIVNVNRFIPVRVANTNNYAVKLNQGTTLGQCDAITSIRGSDKKCADASSPAMKQFIKVNIGKLEESQALMARELLLQHANVFAFSDDAFNQTSLVTHKINTGDSLPIRQHARRLPLAKQKEADDLIGKMAKRGIIESSTSPWLSPVVLVSKKDGTTRFCVDYRKLNDITKKDSYPLPRIDDTLDRLAHTKWFSTLDLKSGYWQVAMDEEDKEKTAFSAGNGLWQFKVMPFGLCNAPSTFERLMEMVLHGLALEVCLVYLDDIIVMGRTFKEHLANLREVFRRLEQANLKANPDKCHLFRKKITYLGHVVGEDGIQTDPTKITSVINWPQPKNIHELRSFLGLCTYYRRFVKDFADISRPLHKLTEGNRSFIWNPEAQLAFEQLKSVLTSAPILTYPTATDDFILDADASNNGIGGILSQVQDGKERVVAYFSKALSKPERNYCVTRKELLAIIKSIEHFHKYLYGRHFHLRTDHAALRWLLNFRNPEGQLARWIERLQSYDFSIEHRAGKIHSNADALSRRPCREDCKYCNRAEEKEPALKLNQIRMSAAQINSDKIREGQQEDPDICIILQAMAAGRRPPWKDVSNQSQTTKSYWAQWDSLRLCDDQLYREWESPDGKERILQLVIPKKYIPIILEELHGGTSGGHLGINKTLNKVRERFYWVRCKEDVEDWCKKCKTCFAANGPHRTTRSRMKQYNVGSPFERIAIDVAGPFPESDRGNKYAMVVMDYFSKWPEVYAIPNQEASTISDMLIENWICRFGVPLEIHTDQGRNFESRLFQEIMNRLGIVKTRTTPLHPQSDGMVERFNRTFERHLAKVVSAHQQDWDQHLPLFLLAYRSAVHETTGQAPSSVIFGRNIKLPGDLLFGKPKDKNIPVADYVKKLEERLEDIHQFTRQHINLVSDRMKARYDIRASEGGFQENDKVWLYNPQRKRGLCPKFQSSWEGPYRIIKRINDVVYRIQKVPRGKFKVVHANRLSPFKDDNRSSTRDEQI